MSSATVAGRLGEPADDAQAVHVGEGLVEARSSRRSSGWRTIEAIVRGRGRAGGQGGADSGSGVDSRSHQRRLISTGVDAIGRRDAAVSKGKLGQVCDVSSRSVRGCHRDPIAGFSADFVAIEERRQDHRSAARPAGRRQSGRSPEPRKDGNPPGAQVIQRELVEAQGTPRRCGVELNPAIAASSRRGGSGPGGHDRRLGVRTCSILVNDRSGIGQRRTGHRDLG